MRVLLIDNYDSFTYNIYQYLAEMGCSVLVVRNDKITLAEIEKLNPDTIFLSPGPKDPQNAGICLEVIRNYHNSIPIFGICLGHQVIAEAFGGNIVNAGTILHGKTSLIHPLNIGIMTLDEPFLATRYHSLIVEKQTLPDCLLITAETDDGCIMGLKHKDWDVEGVQFHPESILTSRGKLLIKNFLERVPMRANKDYEIFDKLISATHALGVAKTHKSSIIEQTVQIVSHDLDIFQLFKMLKMQYHEDEICILDSASGPKDDRNMSIIGVNPKFDLILENGKLYLKTQYLEIEKAFRDELFDLYNENGYFLLPDGKFSSFYNRIQGMFRTNSTLKFSNGLIGMFSYEYLHYLDDIPREKQKDVDTPDVHLTYYSHILTNEGDKVLLISNSITSDVQEQTTLLVDFIKLQVVHENSDKNSAGSSSSEKTNTVEHKVDAIPVSETFSHDEYIKNVEIAKNYIKAGDIFQVQLGIRKTMKVDVNSLALYEMLRAENPSPYMFFWSRNNCTLIGNSPELQLKVIGSDVLIRPIAGTSKGKGQNSTERERVIHELKSSEKEQAEHIMLVDLARNDVGVWSKPGSVKVDDLMSIAEYSHVFHIVSSVSGKLVEGVNPVAVFEATFPAGTLTGAPKIRAMEIIQELEKSERGAYGGAFTFIDFNGNIMSSIIIRTIIKEGNNYHFQSSAGIVINSDTESEWNELQYKTQMLKNALGAIAGAS
ncbi:MAG: chorismate-binding protein [Candidatus Ancillula sp.]|jgi:para-aminobenzoate synthetase|nr:chorismate-binding protein [Candidatus Ancillula sp.]